MPFILVLLFTLSSDLSFSKTIHETNDHNEVYQDIISFNYSPSEILVVYDIDNTILASNKNFGSDQWFNWQKEELKNQSEHSIARSFDELIEIQYQIFSLGQMHLTQTEISHIIASLQLRGHPTIALTSRGPGVRNATERELNRQHINFKSSAIGYGIANSFIPKGQKRAASYQNGIFMTSGMHKGNMLKYILKYFGIKFKAIIFVDDHKKHTDSVFESFKDTNIDINTYRYGYEDKTVRDFLKSNKSESKRLGKEFIALRKKLL